MSNEAKPAILTAGEIQQYEGHYRRPSGSSTTETLRVHPKPIERIPYPIAYFLGYRQDPSPLPEGTLVRALWSFVGVFSSVAVIELLSCQIPLFREHGGPIIVGSFGAAAVLEFYAINSPLAQPRNAIVSQLIASVIGVTIGKMFQLDPTFESIRWIAGALSCSMATAIMGLTGTVHPPAGATALIAVVDNSSLQLGWFLIPLVMLGCATMMVMALILNNIQRRFPVYWWHPGDLDPSGALAAQHLHQRIPDVENPLRDVEEGRAGVVQKPSACARL